MLSQTAKTILEARYFIKDDNGVAKEDPQSFFKRVANNIAEAELLYGDDNEKKKRYAEYSDKFYQLMSSLKFLPNSPTLMNAGTPMQMLSACIGGNVLIYTRNGLKYMRDIQVGDEVLTHTLRFKKVLNVWSNGMKSTIRMSHTGYKSFFDLVCTPDHKILTQTGTWEEAQHVQLAMKPSLWHTDDVKESFMMRDYASPESEIFVECVKNTPELAWVFGMYVACGSICDGSVRFTLRDDTDDYTANIRKLVYYVKKIFGIEPVLRHKYDGFINIIINNETVGCLLAREFGKDEQAMKIPEWMGSCAYEYLNMFTQGVMRNGEITATNALNPTVLYQITLIRRNLPTESQPIHHEEGEIEEVFDMSVEDDHSFVAGDFIVHNCFVLPVEDNMSSIFMTLHDTAQVHRMGGGTGFDFSELRPKDALVGSTKGIASGVVSFMKVYDSATEQVRQGGRRRGANIGILNCSHPEIMDFIKCKDVDGTIQNFNISVAITDEFMSALKNDEYYELKHPKVKETQKVKAKEVWDAIVNQAWKTGDPGLLFIDEVNRHNPIPSQPITATNPSLAKGTRVLTCYGIYEIQDLENKSFTVPTLINNSAPAECLLSGRDKRLYEVTLCGDNRYYATKEHKWVILGEDGEYTKVTTDELRAGHNIPTAKRTALGYGHKGTYDDGFLIGWSYGDGYNSMCAEYIKSDSSDIRVSFRFNKHNNTNGCCKRIIDILYNIIGDNASKRKHTQDDTSHTITISDKKLVDYFYSFGVFHDSNRIPFGIWNVCSESFRKGFMDALLSSSAYDTDNDTLSFATPDEQLANDVSDLLGFYGLRVETVQNLIEGLSPYECVNYPTINWFYVTLSKSAIVQFRDTFKLSSVEKQEKIDSIAKTQSFAYTAHTVVQSVELTDRYEDVWDLRVYDNSHTFYLSHCVTGNCGEIPLFSNSSCNLGSINLSKYFDEDSNIYVKRDELKKDIHTSVRFLDNVIDMNKYPLPQIDAQSKYERKIGLGVMGWADLLTQAEVPYDSNEAVKLAKKIAKFMKDEAVKASEALAEERGAFPAFNDSIFKNGTPRRNSTVLTVAPTGTLSMIADCSGGIEPNFAIAYQKNVLDGKSFIYGNKYFEAKLDELKLDKDTILRKVAETGSVGKITELPEDVRRVFVSSHEIDYEWHIRMQSAWQKYVCNSISKTINLCSTATAEDVAKSYLLAHELKCKGITIYRDGSKAGQVLTSNKQPEPDTTHTPTTNGNGEIKRPKKRHGITMERDTGCGALHCTINETEDHVPFECFITMGKAGGCVSAMIEAIGRVISLGMRYGVPLDKTIKQITGVGCSKPRGMGRGKIFSCVDAVGKMLKDYYEDKEQIQVMTDDTDVRGACPECGAQLEMSEGCVKCSSGCGFSQCG
jgi:ribonucleoside-diphosphate reductase alpha chain